VEGMGDGDVLLEQFILQPSLVENVAFVGLYDEQDACAVSM
jgi:hypothetical protein